MIEREVAKSCMMVAPGKNVRREVRNSMSVLISASIANTLVLRGWLTTIGISVLFNTDGYD